MTGRNEAEAGKRAGRREGEERERAFGAATPKARVAQPAGSQETTARGVRVSHLTHAV
ncbi:MAG: hypothetical protein J2P41_03200 [Blastocatellia bacterium]|nr:hypothetical protein [Blastocatellia bacterium]